MSSHKRIVSVSLPIIMSVLFLVSCQPTTKKRVANAPMTSSKPFVTIYCENGLAPMLSELKVPFEMSHNCRIKIVNDCSSNLVELLNYTKKTDLFIPDATTSFSEFQLTNDLVVTDSVLLGNNRLVLLVQKNNPKQIDGNIKSPIDNNISIAIANPETGSLGRETNKMLNKQKRFSSVSKNIVSLTVDSKGLDNLVKTGEADCAITWITTTKEIDLGKLEILELEPSYESPIYLGLMSCSTNQTIAKYFMDFVTSAEQTTILQQYGVSKRRVQVF